MNDDFRVTMTLDGDGVIAELLENVRAGEVQRDLRDRLGDRVALSRDGDVLFIYASTESDARAAREAVEPLAEQHGLRVVETSGIDRWHPEAERWEDASLPLPETPQEHEAERAELRDAERDESERAGVPEWEVLVTLPDDRAAREYEERLEAEGVSVLRRGNHVMAGAPSEDDASALADRLRAEAPEGARFEVQGNGQAWWSALHPFAVFGGLGG